MNALIHMGVKRQQGLKHEKYTSVQKQRRAIYDNMNAYTMNSNRAVR
jgi:hypothetical protein